MIKDIQQRKVEDIAIAIVPPLDGQADDLWEAFIINLHEEPISGVLVASRGYGEIEGKQQQTSTLRYFFESIQPLSIHKIEPVQPSVFELANEYWVSFSLKDYLFDKKYVFVKGSIAPTSFTLIPFINRKGIMIR